MLFAALTLGSVGCILTYTALRQIRTTYRLFKGTYDWHELSIRGQGNNVGLSFALSFYSILYWAALAMVL
jgi:hypothetical protein